MLYNRIDEEFRDGLNGVTVSLKDQQFSPNNYAGNRFGKLDEVANNERIEMIPSTVKSGQYVKIWIEGRNKILQICEVEVFRPQGKFK